MSTKTHSIITKKRTKIIATMGPVSENAKTALELIKAGVDVFRFNASHESNPSVIKNRVQLIRKAAAKMNKGVGIFMDLQGPKIRIGKFKNEFVTLQTGDTFTITSKNILGTPNIVSVNYPGLVKDVKINDILYIDDGKIRLSVYKKNSTEIFCKILQGGKICDHKGINLPMTDIKLAAVTEKDKKDALLAIKNKMQFVALSFVGKKEDITMLRTHLDEHGGQNIKIIAKIERPSAVTNLIEIVQAADIIMVARGDLGIEINEYNVPHIQKMIIQEAKKQIKPVIVATQMLESMTNSRAATRAEVSDVANAIYDYCDAVMLSGETAVGIDPGNVVRTMSNICIVTDEDIAKIKKQKYVILKHIFNQKNKAISCCIAADQIADELKAKALIAFTSSGATASIASKLNPAIPIIAPTDNENIYHAMSILRGVIPLKISKKFIGIPKWTEMINLAVKNAKQQKLIKKGDLIVVTAGIPIGEPGGTNSIRIIEVA